MGFSEAVLASCDQCGEGEYFEDEYDCHYEELERDNETLIFCCKECLAAWKAEHTTETEAKEQCAFNEWIDEFRPNGSLVKVRVGGEIIETRTTAPPLDGAITGPQLPTRAGVFPLTDCEFVRAW